MQFKTTDIENGEAEKKRSSTLPDEH